MQDLIQMLDSPGVSEKFERINFKGSKHKSYYDTCYNGRVFKSPGKPVGNQYLEVFIILIPPQLLIPPRPLHQREIEKRTED